MATARQETESMRGIEERAIREVDGYIEKMEKKAEQANNGQNGNQGLVVTPSAPVVYPDMGQAVIQATASIGKGKIVLPMESEEVKTALHQRVVEGARWIAEWCVLMIKKYPGRVFYPVRTAVQ